MTVYICVLLATTCVVDKDYQHLTSLTAVLISLNDKTWSATIVSVMSVLRL